ncbi:adenosine deaminase [Leuconostoc mesenteroides]|uniref:adenosine deaminase n=1 Tax=Leuconostoc mesenteroides TaxID=1245 RepID=UPI0038593A00
MTTVITNEFTKKLPKCELHVHIEGTIEPELKLKLAQRNHITLTETTVEDIQKSYQFNDLASFLAVYYPGMSVLITEEDFYDLAFDYLRRAADNNVRHVEIFFDPQAHTTRGIAFKTIITGLHRAIVDARALNVDAALIMCFLRDLPKESARQTLLEALPYKDKFIGVGLDSDEHNNPPLKFARQFEYAAAHGLHLTTHCDIDQKDSIDHIRQALEIMEVERLDHGTNIVEDPDLVNFVIKKGIGLTSCPLSNSFVTPDMKGKELIDLLNQGVKISIHSDDPAYFGGYISDNYYKMATDFNLSKEQLIQLARNSFESAWISIDQKELYLKELEQYAAK